MNIFWWFCSMDFSETVMIERVCLDEDSKGPLSLSNLEGGTYHHIPKSIVNGDAMQLCIFNYS